MSCMFTKYNCKIIRDIKSINASMSSVKADEKSADRKPKGYFEQ